MILTACWSETRIENIVSSDSRLKKKIFRFWAVLCALGFKVVKSANMTLTNIFSRHFDMGIKKRRIGC
jgi:hypothetical protein